jgi:hypothetical protein
MVGPNLTILDHIARFFILLSDAPSYWFSLNTSFDHAFHLSKWLCMDESNYRVLLIAGNLARYKGGTFIIQAQEWISFLFGHHLFLDLPSDRRAFQVKRKWIALDGKRLIALFVAIAVRSPATLVAVAIALPPLPSPLPARHPHRHYHRPCRPCPCPLRRPPALSPSQSPTSSPLPSPSPSPLPSLPSIASHPCRHRSCSHCHRPLCCTPPSLLMPSFSSSPLPSSSPTTLISVTIALSTLTLFVAAIIICRTLSDERRGGTLRLGVSLETHAKIVSKAEVKVKL